MLDGNGYDSSADVYVSPPSPLSLSPMEQCDDWLHWFSHLSCAVAMPLSMLAAKLLIFVLLAGIWDHSVGAAELGGAVERRDALAGLPLLQLPISKTVYLT